MRTKNRSGYMNKLCIIGANETAERVISFCERYNLYDIAGVAVDKEYIQQHEFNGKPVYSIDTSPLASIRGKIGDNCWLMDYSVTQDGSTIGNNVFVADFAFVGNGTKVDNHCFLGPRCTILGSAYIGEQSFVGGGATIFDVVKVGEKCLVGACVILKYDLPKYSVCKVATECNAIKHYSEEEIEAKWIAKHPNRINKDRR